MTYVNSDARSPVIDSGSNDYGHAATLGTNPWVDNLFYPAQWGDNFSISAGEQVAEYLYYFASPEDASNPVFARKFQLNNNTGWDTMAPISEAYKNAYRGAQQHWANVTNLTFREAATLDEANIIIANAFYKNGGDAGDGTFLGSHEGLADEKTGQQAKLPLISDTNAYPLKGKDLGIGSSFFATAVHETGHGIGLSHPHDRGLGVSSSGVFPGLKSGDSFGAMSLGLFGLVQTPFTIMSYKRGYTNPTMNNNEQLYADSAITPMALDIAAAQIKYGVNRDTNSGDTVYAFNPEIWQCLYDAGGIDKVKVSNDSEHYSRGITINLRPAEMNAVQPDTGLPMEQYIFDVEGDIEKALNCLITAQSSSIGAPLGMGARMAGMVSAILSSDERDAFLSKYKDSLEGITSDLAQLDGEGINFMQVLSGYDQYDGFTGFQHAMSNIYPDNKPQGIQNAFNLLAGAYEAGKTFLSDIGAFYKELFKDTVGPNSYAANLASLNAQQQALLERSAEGIAGYPSTMESLNGGFTIAAGVIIENATGGGGNDTLIGNAARNVLRGREGDDQINGYFGADKLIGGAGRDVFVYANIADSTAKKGEMDTIVGFTRSDRISLTELETSINNEINIGTNRVTDSYRLSFVGADRFSGKAGEIRFRNQELQIDINGDKMADMAILMPGLGRFSEENLITLSTVPTQTLGPQNFL